MKNANYCFSVFVEESYIIFRYYENLLNFVQRNWNFDRIYSIWHKNVKYWQKLRQLISNFGKNEKKKTGGKHTFFWQCTYNINIKKFLEKGDIIFGIEKFSEFWGKNYSIWQKLSIIFFIIYKYIIYL